MPLGHLSQGHPAEVQRFFDPVHTTGDITPVAALAFERIEEDQSKDDERRRQG
jgi:hypothetical protein